MAFPSGSCARIPSSTPAPLPLQCHSPRPVADRSTPGDELSSWWRHSRASPAMGKSMANHYGMMGRCLKKFKKTWMGQVESTHESRKKMQLQYIQFMRISTNISILLRSYFPLQKLNPWRPILPRNSPVHRSHPQCKGRPVAEGSLVSSSAS